MDRYSRKETIIAYWAFGLYWGKAVSQNKKGHLIGHIKVSKDFITWIKADSLMVTVFAIHTTSPFCQNKYCQTGASAVTKCQHCSCLRPLLTEVCCRCALDICWCCYRTWTMILAIQTHACMPHMLLSRIITTPLTLLVSCCSTKVCLAPLSDQNTFA